MLKSSVTHTLSRRRAEYLVLNKQSKMSADFRLCKILMRIYLELHMTLKKANCRYTQFSFIYLIAFTLITILKGTKEKGKKYIYMY